MSETNNLGAFWGNDGIYFIESDETNPGQEFHVLFKDKSKIPIKKGFLNPWEAELSENIKTSLQELKIATTTVNLSLPTKEIIFRNFTLPWMSQNEVKSAVEFEASKYIPFSLEELKYSYRSTIITKKNSKHITKREHS